MQPTYTVLKKDYTGCPDKQSLNGQLLNRLYSTRRSFVNFITLETCCKQCLLPQRHTKELSLWNKIKYLNPNIFRTRCCQPLIFQTQII